MSQPLAMATRGKQNLTTTEIAYLAGLLDADGSISISKMSVGQRVANPRYVLYLNIVNTSEVLMKWLVEKFGGTYTRRTMSKPDRHKPTFDWRYTNGKALFILELIEPFLIIKRERALLGIEFIKHWQSPKGGKGAMTPLEEVERRERCYQQMKELNQFGIVSSRND